jgi:hypothetical protein
MLHGTGVPVDPQEDVLEDIVGVRITVDPACDKGAEAVTEL